MKKQKTNEYQRAAKKIFGRKGKKQHTPTKHTKRTIHYTTKHLTRARHRSRTTRTRSRHRTRSKA